MTDNDGDDDGDDDDDDDGDDADDDEDDDDADYDDNDDGDGCDDDEGDGDYYAAYDGDDDADAVDDDADAVGDDADAVDAHHEYIATALIVTLSAALNGATNDEYFNECDADDYALQAYVYGMQLVAMNSLLMMPMTKAMMTMPWLIMLATALTGMTRTRVVWSLRGHAEVYCSLGCHDASGIT